MSHIINNMNSKQRKNHRKMVGEMEQQKLRELDRPKREPNRKLGEGGYGEVYEGIYRNEPVGIVQNDIKWFL